jgi:hypothetical protein
MPLRVVEILWKPQELRGNLVAGGGITGPPRSTTQGFSIRLAYLAESLGATNIAVSPMDVDIVDARLTTFTPSQKFSFMVSLCDEFGVE